eukprot:m.44516 g.44516  ORF g.44516 m.44516 type:complete len:100 (-) comp12116_c0_seq1:397-696(-)
MPVLSIHIVAHMIIAVQPEHPTQILHLPALAMATRPHKTIPALSFTALAVDTPVLMVHTAAEIISAVHSPHKSDHLILAILGEKKPLPKHHASNCVFIC